MTTQATAQPQLSVNLDLVGTIFTWIAENPSGTPEPGTFQHEYIHDGERQGVVNATTTIAGVATPVEWRTWASRVDRIRLRDLDAVRFVQEIDDQGASEFRLELQDDPDLLATYDVSNLLTAIAANEMTCFEGQ